MWQPCHAGNPASPPPTSFSALLGAKGTRTFLFLESSGGMVPSTSALSVGNPTSSRLSLSAVADGVSPASLRPPGRATSPACARMCFGRTVSSTRSSSSNASALLLLLAQLLLALLLLLARLKSAHRTAASVARAAGDSAARRRPTTTCDIACSATSRGFARGQLTHTHTAVSAARESG